MSRVYSAVYILMFTQLLTYVICTVQCTFNVHTRRWVILMMCSIVEFSAGWNRLGFFPFLFHGHISHAEHLHLYFFSIQSLLFIYLFIFCCCCCWNRKSVYRHCAHTGSCCTETALLQRLSIKSESKDAPSSHVDAGCKTVRSFLELPSFRILLLGFQCFIAEHFLPGPESFLNRRPSALICMKRKRERADQLGWIWLESLSFQHRSGCLSSDN